MPLYPRSKCSRMLDFWLSAYREALLKKVMLSFYVAKRPYSELLYVANLGCSKIPTMNYCML